MDCENYFCVYQSKGKCTLKNVAINSLGMCDECIYPDIDEEIVNIAKFQFLKKYQNDKED